MAVVFLVCWGCSNRISQPAWLMNNRNVSLTALEGKSEASVPARSGPLPGCGLLLVASCSEKSRERNEALS